MSEERIYTREEFLNRGSFPAYGIIWEPFLEGGGLVTVAMQNSGFFRRFAAEYPRFTALVREELKRGDPRRDAALLRELAPLFYDAYVGMMECGAKNNDLLGGSWTPES